MRNSIKRSIAGVLISTTLFSNCLYVYAHDKNEFDNFVKNVKKILKDETKSLNKYIIRGNALRSNYAVYEESKKNKFNNIEEEEEDTDDVLDLLNMDIDDYKQQLLEGEDLRSLLVKCDAKEEFEDLAYKNYKKILETALANNALTMNEMNSLLDQYISNTELLNI